MRQKINKIGIPVIVIILFISSGMIYFISYNHNPETENNATNEFTPYNWNYSDPEDQGFNASKLNSLTYFVNSVYPQTTSVLVLRNGYIVYEHYFSGDNTSLHHVFSVTKSVTSILIGIAINKGFLKDINQKVLDIFPERKFQNVNAQKNNITISNLLTMTSGIQWDELSISYDDPQNSYILMSNKPDWAQFYLDLPMAYNPGEHYTYSTGSSQVFSAIIQKVTNMTTFSFATKYLLNPLGINSSSIQWLSDNSSVTRGGVGLYLTPKDMAKIGYLYLNNGTWNGNKIVPKNWVIESTTNHSPSPNNPYGYQWRIHFNGYSALGYGSQRIYIVPEKNLIFVMTALLYGNDIIPANEMVNSIIIPAIIN